VLRSFVIEECTLIVIISGEMAAERLRLFPVLKKKLGDYKFKDARDLDTVVA
jgi:hypothetical protein